jgi:putative nucleotidyltransferase with HDIG domain
MANTSKRILFIDDEPALLDALRRMLRSLRGEWDVQVESSPAAALSRLDEEAFDVVVTDMRMPAIDGVSVLTAVMQRHPEVIRLVLSGQTELEAAMRAVPVAHQFLAKPCDPTQLKNTIARISRMRDRLHDENMRALIGEIDGLPAMPAVCRELNDTLGRSDYTIRDVAAVVEKDPAVCAKILQLVNSSFFGLGRRLSHVQDAVSFLGTTMIKNLVTSVTLWRAIEGVRPSAVKQLESIHAHCQEVGALARRMMGKNRARAEEAFVAGLLHDIGMTLLLAYLPERYDRITLEAVRRQVPFHEAERTIYDVNHAELGAYLLDAWGLPFPVLEAVAFHHAALTLEHTELASVDAVFVAMNMLDARRSGDDVEGALDPIYIEKLGAAEQWGDWMSWVRGV